MEKKSEASASASSSSTTGRQPLVFLSYDADDLCCANFVSHLDRALTRQGISNYRGYGAFEANRAEVSVVIFSEGYTSSRLCMTELVKIMESCKTNEHEVVLVYYELDPSKYVARPLDYFTVASRKIGSFRGVFESNTLQRWAKAVDWASKLPPGLDSIRFRDEASIIEEVVWLIWNTFYPPGSNLCSHRKYEVYLSYRAGDDDDDVEVMERLFAWLSEVSSKESLSDGINSLKADENAVKFGSNLFKALTDNGISVCSHSTTQGVIMKQEIIDIMREIETCVIIFSDGFASSRHCLNELSEILSHIYYKKNIIIVPVQGLVTVDNVDEYFEKAFHLHTENGVYEYGMQLCRDAWQLIIQSPYWKLRETQNDGMFVQSVVQHVLRKLVPGQQIAGVQVLRSQDIDRIEYMLRLDMSNVRVVGMLGEDGIGKTTIAKALYDKIKTRFDKFYYIANVNERVEIDVQNRLRNKLLSGPSSVESLSMRTLSLGLTFRNDPSLCHLKVLLFVDDVDDPTHVEEFIADREKIFGLGSRILITSRNNSVIQNLQLDAAYEVERMNEYASVQIFRSFFPGARFTKYPSFYRIGNPLAIRIICSALKGKSKSEWISAAKQIKANPFNVQDVLRWSYDMLKEEEKKLFLDIACFFVGEKRDDAMKILDDHHHYIGPNFIGLEKRYLVSTSLDGKLEMHNSLQEMAWSIVGEEFCAKPGKRSKLWNPENLYRLFMKRQKKWMMLGCSSSLCLISQ